MQSIRLFIVRFKLLLVAEVYDRKFVVVVYNRNQKLIRSFWFDRNIAFVIDKLIQRVFAVSVVLHVKNLKEIKHYQKYKKIVIKVKFVQDLPLAKCWTKVRDL